MIVEPMAGDRVEDNLNPVGRAYYGFSTLICTPASLSQEVGLALGTQAGPARIHDVTTGPASPASAARPARRSTTSWKPDPDAVAVTIGCSGSHVLVGAEAGQPPGEAEQSEQPPLVVDDSGPSEPVLDEMGEYGGC